MVRHVIEAVELVSERSKSLAYSRLWELVKDPSLGRLGHALRMSAGCCATVLLCEMWKVPDLSTPALVTMALWQKDRVTNAIAGVGVNVLILVLLAIVYGLVMLTLDHPLGLVVVIALLSFGLFFLGSASKLRPVAYMLGLILVYALVAIDQIPVGEVISRALLYTDLFIAVPGTVMVCLGLLICPSPKSVLVNSISERLKMAAAVMCSQEREIRMRAMDMLRMGSSDLEKNLKMAAMEKIWSAHDLACLKQASINCVSILALALDAPTNSAPPALLRQIDLMADIFKKGGYPTEIDHISMADNTDAIFGVIAARLSNFTTLPPGSVEEQSSKTGFLDADAFTNPDHVRYAVKGTAAVMACYFLFRVLDWQGIHTCIMTCFIVALPTMGQMIAKQTLRITGALFGGAMGILSVIYVQPHLQTIAGFLVLVFIGSFIGAWVKTGDERIAYAGFQIGIAFFLTNLNGFGPTSDMETPRDRIIGILIGIFITYSIFTSFWPATSYDHVSKKISKVSKLLATLRQTTMEPEINANFCKLQSALSEAERELEYAEAEPPHMQPDHREIRAWHRKLESASQEASRFLYTGAGGLVDVTEAPEYSGR